MTSEAPLMRHEFMTVVDATKIDRNRHENNAAYHVDWQLGREGWIERFIANPDLNLHIQDLSNHQSNYQGRFDIQVFEGDKLVIVTDGTTHETGLEFKQRTMRDDVRTSWLDYSIGNDLSVKEASFKPSLNAFDFELKVTQESITPRKTNNDSYYIYQFELAREAYMATFGAGLDELEDQHKMLAVMFKFSGSFSNRIPFEETLKTHTQTEIYKRGRFPAAFKFYQQMINNWGELASFNCDVFLISTTEIDPKYGRPLLKDIPEEIQHNLNSLNLT